MNELNLMEVNFFKYCRKCKYRKIKEYKDPCNECLANPWNEYSQKPVKFEEKKKGEKYVT